VTLTEQPPTEQPPLTRLAPPGWLLSSEVAEILHVSPKTVSRWAKEGKLHAVKTLGGHRRFDEAKIRALAETLHER
jgi:excisionase family DNA binding protein